MLRRVTAAKGAIKLCGTCIDARGLAGGELIEDAAQGSMDELASLTLSAHKVVVC